MKLYYGIVENIIDPLFLGRCQVRIVGKHTANRTDPTEINYMPVDDLPWAMGLQNLGAGLISNIGGVGVPLMGSVVILTFMDADEQHPIMLGVVPKIAESEVDFEKGFTDPTGINPTPESIGIPPISSFATGIPIPPQIVNKNNNLAFGVTCIGGWLEPASPFAPFYPFNKVIQSIRHVIELDDSPGAERLHLYHGSGSFDETHPDGTKVEKTVGDKYLVIEGDYNVLVKGSSQLTIQAIGKSVGISIVGDACIAALGDVELTCKEVDVTAVESVTINAGVGVTLNAVGNVDINCSTASISALGVVTVTAGLISLN